jgi:hypothetical protein
MTIDKSKQSNYFHRNLSQANMSITKHMWAVWGSDPGLHDEKLVTNCLSCGIVMSTCTAVFMQLRFHISHNHENIFSLSSYVLFNEELVIGALSGGCRRVDSPSLTICLMSSAVE